MLYDVFNLDPYDDLLCKSNDCKSNDYTGTYDDDVYISFIKIMFGTPMWAS